MFQSLLQEVVTSSRRLSFVLIQEPPLVRGVVPSFGGFTYFHRPLSLGHARVATYVESSVARGLAVSSAPATSPLMMKVVLSSHSGICVPPQKTLRIINIYNPPRNAASTAQHFTPSDIFPPGAAATLVTRDFNLHHYSTDPSRVVSQTELLTADPFFSMADLWGFSLLNTPGVYTRFPLSGVGRPSVLDLAFASCSLSPFLTGWDTPYESTGSDHMPVLVLFATSGLLPPHPTPDWSRVDWVATLESLKSMSVHPHPQLLTAQALDT